MAAQQLSQLAQNMEWLGCELEYQGHKHALEGYPEAGPTWETFREKQRGVLVTADKIERELKTAVSFNPATLMGVEFPLEATLDAITVLLDALQEIRHAAVFAVHELPSKVRTYTRMVDTYLSALGTVRR